jgi:hypothetical protein
LKYLIVHLSLVCIAFALSSCSAHPQGPKRASDTRIKVGTAPSAVELADFNRDGKLDAAVANSESDNVTILLGDGKGDFKPAPGSPFPAGNEPNDLAIGDINNDGNLDLAFANHDTTYLTVLVGDGKGGFKPQTGSPFTVQSKPHPHGIAIADFNGDSWADLATDDWQNNRVTVIFNDRKGGFLSPGVSFAVGKMPYQKLRAADLNKDGKADIVTTNFEGGNVTVLLGDGKGGFKEAPGSPFDSNKQPFAIAIGDLNGDGTPDLAVGHYSGHITDTSGDRMTILLGVGDGTFQQVWSQLAPGKAPTRVAIGDVNGDKIADAVFANYGNNSVTVVLGSRNDFNTASGWTTGAGRLPSGLAIGDLNADGRGDIVTANYDDNDISIILTK